MENSVQQQLNKLNMLVMDVDGVLTDGSIIINADGSESKHFSVLDGHRIKMWARTGMKTAIISGRESAPTQIRAQQLDIDYVMQGCKFKLPAFEKLLSDSGRTEQQVVYIGDDLMDIPVARRAGFSAAVANASQELKSCCDYVTSIPGGKGAVAEVIEYILKNTGKWQGLMERYLV